MYMYIEAGAASVAGVKVSRLCVPDGNYESTEDVKRYRLGSHVQTGE